MFSNISAIFSNIRISLRLALGIVLTLALVVGLMLPAVLKQLNDLSERAETDQLKELHNVLQSSVRDSSDHALVTITSVVNAPGVAAAFANKDRAQLQALTLPVFEALKKQHNISQFQFHLPPATSFLRLHQLEKHSDDLSSFRATVVQANEAKKSQSGLESGVAGIGLRGVIPVFYQNSHIGSAEIGLSFGQDFFDGFKKQYNAPTALHIRANSGYKVFATTIPGSTTLTQAQIAKAMDGQTLVSQATREGREWTVMAKSVPDFSGKAVAVAEILMDRSYYVENRKSTLYRILAIGLLALTVGLLFTWALSRSITRPIVQLTRVAEDISRGKFEEQIESTQRGDEIGNLARAVERMATSIRIAMGRIKRTAS